MAVELVLFCTRETMSIFPVYELECSEMALATSSVEFLPPSPRRVRVTAATGHVAGAHPAFGDDARNRGFQTRGTLRFVEQIADSLRQLWRLPANDFSEGYVY